MTTNSRFKPFVEHLASTIPWRLKVQRGTARDEDNDEAEVRRVHDMGRHGRRRTAGVDDNRAERGRAGGLRELASIGTVGEGAGLRGACARELGCRRADAGR